jgi:hypothetical protein
LWFLYLKRKKYWQKFQNTSNVLWTPEVLWKVIKWRRKASFGPLNIYLYQLFFCLVRHTAFVVYFRKPRHKQLLTTEKCKKPAFSFWLFPLLYRLPFINLVNSKMWILLFW